MSDKPDGAIAPWLRYLPKLDLSALMLDAGVARPRSLLQLGRAANHLKAAKQAWEEAAAQKEVAGVARWLIETPDLLLEQASRTLENQARGPSFLAK